MLDIKILISLATIVGGGFFAWGDIRSDVDTLQDNGSYLRQDIKEIKKDVKQILIQLERKEDK